MQTISFKTKQKRFFLRITHKKEFQELAQIAQCILVIWALRPKKLWEVWLLSKLPGCDHASQHHHKSVLLELLKGNHCLISLFSIYYLVHSALKNFEKKDKFCVKGYKKNSWLKSVGKFENFILILALCFNFLAHCAVF